MAEGEAVAAKGTGPGSMTAAPRAAGRDWVTLGLLGGLYFMSFVDRVILALLIGPLKADLHITDVQVGLLFGPAFAAFYALVGLPLARLADRGPRLPLIVLGGAVWGLCTIASGFVNSFGLLVALRVGLAIGEAALTPAAYSLIGSAFAPDQRIRAASLYSAVGVGGAYGAYILGAGVIQLVGSEALPLAGGALLFRPWQMALVAVGLPAVVGAVIVGLVGREPPRRVQGSGRSPALLRQLRTHAGMYAPLFLGAGVLQAVNAAFAAWGPEYLHRVEGWSIGEAGWGFGVAGLIGASLGVLLVPALGRRWQAAGRADAIARVALAAGALGGVAACVAPLTASGPAFLALQTVAAFGLYGSSTGLVVALQIIAPLPTRAQFVALLILSITFFGQGLGPPAVAFAGSLLGAGLGSSLSLVSLAALAPGMLLLAMARRPLATYLARQREAQGNRSTN